MQRASFREGGVSYCVRTQLTNRLPVNELFLDVTRDLMLGLFLDVTRDLMLGLVPDVTRDPMRGHDGEGVPTPNEVSIVHER